MIVQQIHHRPPASSIAFSSARLPGVRRAPELRGSSGAPSSARRAASRAANSVKSTRGPGHGSASGADVFDAMIAETFLADTPIEILEINVGVKGEQDARLIEAVVSGA